LPIRPRWVGLPVTFPFRWSGKRSLHSKV